jgi:hypothetical protein
MILFFLLAQVLCWDPVTTDCSGGPETISHYIVQLGVRENALHINGCTDESGDPFDCWGYEDRPSIDFETVVGATCNDFDYELSPELIPDPPLHFLYYWPSTVIAIDTAGNRSGDPCL